MLPLQFIIINHSKLTVKAKYAGIPFTIYPRPEKPVSLEKEKKRMKKKQRKAKKSKKKTDKKGKPEMSFFESLMKEGLSSVTEFLVAMVKLTTKGTRRLLLRFVIDRFYLDATVAHEDAAKTAVLYGQACAVFYPAYAYLNSKIRIKKKRISIHPDFLKEFPEIRADIRFHILPVKILWVGILVIIDYIGYTMHKNKEDKSQNTGGAPSKA